MPCIAVPNYDPQVESLSLRTSMPSSAGGTSASGPPIAVAASELSVTQRIRPLYTNYIAYRCGDRFSPFHEFSGLRQKLSRAVPPRAQCGVHAVLDGSASAECCVQERRVTRVASVDGPVASH